MHEVLKSYLKRLTNLTGNNRSLLLLKPPKQQFVDIYDFNFLTKGGAFKILENLMAEKKTVLCSVMDSRDEDSNRASKRLRALSRLDKFIYDERGSKDLYVGWPFVRGKLSDGTLVRCPILFFPVSLSNDKDKWVLNPREEAGISLNKSFLLAYAHFNQIHIPDEFIDRNLEDFDEDSTIFRTALYQLLKDSPVELNFNQENFEDRLKPFENFTKADFVDNEKEGELKLYPEAMIGIFPQAGSHLVPDYNMLIQNNNIEDIESFFASRSIAEMPEKKGFRHFSFLDSVEEEKTITPFKMDAHQENALKAIKKGSSIVVQGPPGTGKSQLISNLIADHIAIGKKVLVVCQKRAALDVVYQRMKEKEMTDFLGLVHDFRNDKKVIYDQIAHQIDRIDEYKMKNNGLDAIQLERKFLQVSRKIDQSTNELEEFKFALFDEAECGVSIKELYLTSNRNEPSVNFKQDYTNFRFDEIEDFSLKLKHYTSYANLYNRSEYPWVERKSFARLTSSDESQILEYLDEIPRYQNELAGKIEKILGERLTIEDAEAILNKRDFMVEMLGMLKNEKIYKYFKHIMQYPDGDPSTLWLSNTERVLMECYKGLGPEVSLPADQLGKFQETLQRSMDARSSILRLIQWGLFSKDKYWIKRVLVENQLKRNRDGFTAMVEKIDNRLNLEHNITKLKNKEWLIDLPDSYQKVHFQNWFYLQKLAVKCKTIFTSFRNFKEYFNLQKLTFPELKNKLEDLFLLIKEIPEKKVVWKRYLSDAQLSLIINNTAVIEGMKSSLRTDFDSLCDFDQLKENIHSNQLNAIDRLMETAQDKDYETIEALFQNSLRLAWIEHIETKYPLLRSVSSMKFQQMEAELQNNVSEKMALSNDMLLLRARERTYEKVEYNRLNNMVTYRDLLHQVTKKRRVWPLRKLISHFDMEMFDLLPCWLASPESVSAIFPMKEMFDLVIFDEASQCFVERGIPSMYRGRQIVIAGDEKQLQPNDLYQVRFEEEKDDIPELEIDSLLDLAKHHLLGLQLKGHYRSKSLDLIDFSNKYFYEGNLKLLPDFNVVNAREPAITYVKIDGVWDKNVNKIEAHAVVDLLKEIAINTPDKDVGVVTFNAKQQQYILDVIDQRTLQDDWVFPETWFVKNIENVQGDEKDIIIFSTTYAPDEKGNMVMQFGSLNALNGENRLNVAITRAREKITIVSSILPQQLNVEESKNDGPKLLKKYLQYALDVSNGNFVPTLPPEPNRREEWYLKSRVINWSSNSFDGYDFSQELPFADVTIRHDDRYVGLMLTDDNLYYQSMSIKDMHVYTPFVLTKKNWKFKTLFSREVWNNEQQVEEVITRFVRHHTEE